MNNSRSQAMDRAGETGELVFDRPEPRQNARGATPPAVMPAALSDAQIMACFADTKADGQGAYMLAVGRAILALTQTMQPQAGALEVGDVADLYHEGTQNFYRARIEAVLGTPVGSHDYDLIYSGSQAAPAAGEQAGAVTDAQLQALWDEACNDSPSNPGWSRHLRFGRSVARLAAPGAAIAAREQETRDSQTITLCGSVRFERLFKAWNEALTMAGHTVFSLTAYPSDKAGVKQWYTEEQKAALDAAHFRKIAASDAIFVLNLHAYIGESTLREIEHARQLGKTVYFLESWGKGNGISRAHTDEAQHAAEADGLSIPTASPIDTTTRSGSRDPWASSLLGPAGAVRSSIVELTKSAALAAPAAAQEGVQWLPWQAISEDDLSEYERFITEGGPKMAAFFPVEANKLANLALHCIREVRAARLAATPAPEAAPSAKEGEAD